MKTEIIETKNRIKQPLTTTTASLVEKNSKIGLKDEVILRAYNDAMEAGQLYALKALICGQLLNEKRVELAPLCKDCTTGQFRSKNGAEFDVWLRETFPLNSRRNLYYWMRAAERVVKTHLHLGAKEKLPTVIDIGGRALPISHALLAPVKELPPVARELRENVFTFMQDKSIAEAVAIRLEGEKKGRRGTTTEADSPVVSLPASAPATREFIASVAVHLRKMGVEAAVAPDLTKDEQGYLDQQRLMELAAQFESAMVEWPLWFLRVMTHAVARSGSSRSW